ncbi:hypothetical protein EIP86_010108, partial [Pleurotus ostreatoroseus]
GTADPLVTGFSNARHKSYARAEDAWGAWVVNNLKGRVSGVLHDESMVGFVRRRADGQNPPPYEV